MSTSSSSSSSTRRGHRHHGNGSGEKNSIKLSVDVSGPGSGSKVKSHASVYMTVDNSGSMAGSKLTQVMSSIREIIDKAPVHVRFVIRSFSDEVRMLVSKQKKYLDVDRAMTDLGRVGGRTKLYDAWGVTIKEIPYENLKSDRIYILVFTDGEDNFSTEYNLDSVTSLVHDTMRSNVYFTFIQTGPSSPSVEALKQKCRHRQCQVLNVEDSAQGIRIAFDKVREQIRLHFEIQLPLSSSASPQGLIQGLKELKVCADNSAPKRYVPKTQTPSKTMAATTTTTANHRREKEKERHGSKKESHFPEKRNTFGQDMPLPIRLAMESTANHSLSSAPPFWQINHDDRGAVGGRGGDFLKSGPSTHSVSHKMGPNFMKNSSAGEKSGREMATGSLSGGGGGGHFKIRIDNVPLALQPADVATIFSQWGKCKTDQTGFGKTSQWVILSYGKEGDRNAAVMNANNFIVHGQTLKVTIFS